MHFKKMHMQLAYNKMSSEIVLQHNVRSVKANSESITSLANHIYVQVFGLEMHCFYQKPLSQHTDSEKNID